MDLKEKLQETVDKYNEVVKELERLESVKHQLLGRAQTLKELVDDKQEGDEPEEPGSSSDVPSQPEGGSPTPLAVASDPED